MSEERVIRINKVLREFNISLERAVDYLKDKGIAIESNPNAKISDANMVFFKANLQAIKEIKKLLKKWARKKEKKKKHCVLKEKKKLKTNANSMKNAKSKK